MEVIRLGLTKCEGNTGRRWAGWGQGAKIDAGMRTPIWGRGGGRKNKRWPWQDSGDPPQATH